ncbi:MAG: fatty acid--CoA ligase family protein [Rhodospirillales bacterium]
MESIETVIQRMRAQGSQPAVFWRNAWLSYHDLFQAIEDWRKRLRERDIGHGSVIGLYGDYSPGTIALVYALMLERAVIVPFTRAVERELPGLLEIAGVERLFRFDDDDNWSDQEIPNASRPDLIQRFMEQGTPGLVVFSSGSSGQPKGILQDCERVMRKFVTPRDGWRTVLFLMIDHFGGFNTLLGTFAYGGGAVCVDQRLPENVCRTIEAAKATLLPTTPTFLNLVIASGCAKSFDLSSLKLITYGTEMMPEETLKRLGDLFSEARVKQTYGLSELGVLRSKTVDEKSTWLRVGGAGFETKVVDGQLWIRSEANMVGYLNAPNPFDADGWMNTGDRVEVNGDMIRFLGRESDIINVGGQKVFPAEVEAVLLQADGIADATVYGVDNRLLGKVVEARVILTTDEEEGAAVKRLRAYCLEHLAKFKVPARIRTADAAEIRSERFKKIHRFETE